MQSTTYDTTPARGRLLPSQIAIYAVIAIGTASALWPVAAATWHQSQGGKASAALTADTKEPLADEVQTASDHWKKDGFAWTLQTGPSAKYDPILPVDMRGLESADLSGYRKAATANWQNVESLPTLSGNYQRRRVAASAWPQPGSAAIELTPMMATDPDRPAHPWRVVLLFAASKDDTTQARQAVADAGNNNAETIKLGRAALSTLAVPVDRQTVGGLVTYYCICPTANELEVAGVKLTQATQPSEAEKVAKRHTAWQSSYDNFVATVRERDRTATTPEQHQQIKNDVLAWKAANPEPPRSVGTDPGA